MLLPTWEGLSFYRLRPEAQKVGESAQSRVAEVSPTLAGSQTTHSRWLLAIPGGCLAASSSDTGGSPGCRERH